MTRRTIHHVVAEAAKAAGIEFPVHPHMLRHAIVSIWRTPARLISGAKIVTRPVNREKAQSFNELRIGI